MSRNISCILADWGTTHLRAWALGSDGAAIAHRGQGGGLLAVKDRRAAEQGLAELLARVGGSEVSRRRDAAQSVVEVSVPEARYAEFARGLTALGVWSPEPHPTVLSTEPAQLRVTIRISE